MGSPPPPGQGVRRERRGNNRPPTIPEHFAAGRARREALVATREGSAEDHEFLKFSWPQLFTAQNRYTTPVGVLFVLDSPLAIWTSQLWLPTIQAMLLHKPGIAGYVAFGFLADAFGRRGTIMMCGLSTVISGVGPFGFATASAVMTGAALISVVAMLMRRETRDDALPK